MVALLASARQARRSRIFSLLVITTAGSAAVYATFLLSPLQETIRLALKLTDNQMALLQGPALYLPSAVAAAPLGLLLDRFSRSKLLFAFTLLEIIGSLLTAAAPSFRVLCLARVLIGLMMCATAMDVFALMAGYVEPQQRGRLIMIAGIAQFAATSLAFALGGQLVAILGSGPTGWRQAMLWLTVPLVFVCILCLFVHEPPRPDRRTRQTTGPSALRGIWHYRQVMLPIAFGPVFVGMGYTAALVWATPILSRHFGLLPDRSGAIVATVLLASGTLGPLLGGCLADLCQSKGGPRRTVSLLVTLALLQIPAGLFGIMPSVLWTSMLLGALSTICYMKGIIGVTLSTVVIPDELRGLALGISSAVGAVFASASPLIVSLLASHTGGANRIGAALSVVCIATSLSGAVVFALGRSYFPGTN